MNFELWHEEDIARRDDLGAERVLAAKRKIDACNHARNDAMEQIDLWILQVVQKSMPHALCILKRWHDDGPSFDTRLETLPYARGIAAPVSRCRTS
jgi:hypothetical protein